MSLADIKGQDFAVRFLKAVLAKERSAHAYLFLSQGSSNDNSIIAAKAFAKALNCLQGKDKSDDSCDICQSCLKIEKDAHPDVKWVRPQGQSRQIEIDQIRQLRRDAYLRPYEGKKKVYIIVDADYMNDEASNALLKILEEPPSSSLLILIAKNKERLFSTIVSRCHILRFLDKTYRFEMQKEVSEEEERHIIKTFLEGKEEEFFGRTRQELGDILLILTGWFRKMLFLKLGIEKFNPKDSGKDNISSFAKKYTEDDLINIITFISRARQLIIRNVNSKLVLASISMQILGGRYAPSSAD